LRLHIERVDHARETFGGIPTLGIVRAQPRVVSVLGEIDCETLNQARVLAELRKLGEGQTLELLARTDPRVSEFLNHGVVPLGICHLSALRLAAPIAAHQANAAPIAKIVRDARLHQILIPHGL
jgi:hypothetical protein